jgi:hypothetical protein
MAFEQCVKQSCRVRCPRLLEIVRETPHSGRVDQNFCVFHDGADLFFSLPGVCIFDHSILRSDVGVMLVINCRWSPELPPESDSTSGSMSDSIQVSYNRHLPRTLVCKDQLLDLDLQTSRD